MANNNDEVDNNRYRVTPIRGAAISDALQAAFWEGVEGLIIEKSESEDINDARFGYKVPETETEAHNTSNLEARLLE